MFNAFLEPCYPSGISTNGNRVVAAVALPATIPLASPKVTDYSIRPQQVALLSSGTVASTIATFPRKRDRLHRDSYVTSPSFGSAAGVVFSVCVVVGIRQAQDLAPRAYVITPLHSNAIIQTWARYDGSINYNGALPVSGATGTYNVEIFSCYHSFSFFGRSANVVASLPYALGSFQGTALGAEQHLYRSGLLDSVYRFSVNLKGGPAMSVQNS
jgi:hypothetical protein